MAVAVVSIFSVRALRFVILATAIFDTQNVTGIPGSGCGRRRVADSRLIVAVAAARPDVLLSYGLAGFLEGSFVVNDDPGLLNFVVRQEPARLFLDGSHHFGQSPTCLSAARTGTGHGTFRSAPGSTRFPAFFDEGSIH
jgi:hypothetical protein